MKSIKQCGIAPKIIAQLQEVFARFAAIDRVILYGSRAKGNYKAGSDIDISIKTKGEAENSLLYAVIDAIDELDLVYYFDISLFDKLENPELIEHIQRVGVQLYAAK
jgi:predicted nucleotidyltransferase